MIKAKPFREPLAPRRDLSLNVKQFALINNLVVETYLSTEMMSHWIEEPGYPRVMDGYSGREQDKILALKPAKSVAHRASRVQNSMRNSWEENPVPGAILLTLFSQPILRESVYSLSFLASIII